MQNIVLLLLPLSYDYLVLLAAMIGNESFMIFIYLICLSLSPLSLSLSIYIYIYMHMKPGKQ